MSKRFKRFIATLLILSGAVVVQQLSGGIPNARRHGEFHSSPPLMPLANSGSHAEQAVQLRTSLERVLGQHAFLSARLVRLRAADNPGYVDAAVSALARNTQDLAELVGRVYGPDAQATFVPIWESHETSVLNYTRARIDSDAAGERLARDQLAIYPRRMAVYLDE